MNKHGVSRRWFTETDVKHFTSGALRNHKYNQAYGNLEKRIPSQVYFKDVVHRYRKVF